MICDISTRKKMKCEQCGNKTNVIFINSKHEKLCDNCFEKEKKEEGYLNGHNK